MDGSGFRFCEIHLWQLERVKHCSLVIYVTYVLGSHLHIEVAYLKILKFLCYVLFFSALVLPGDTTFNSLVLLYSSYLQDV